MSYLKFDKSRLVNLEYSLSREVLQSNRAGSYISTTISGCNTRKYHGLLICPVDELDGDKHVLLSSLDETIIQHGAEFNLGIHKYEGDFYEPKGHKYIRDFEVDRVPVTTFRVGGAVFSKERILIQNEQQVLTKYTLLEANSPTTLRFKPFLAFRNIHILSKANLYANTKFKTVPNGIKIRLYDGYPYLHMQFSKPVEFIPVPNWYNNIEYLKEKNRGYDSKEDLFVPGYFELPIKKGESIVFSASTSEANPNTLKTKYTRELEKHPPRDSFMGNLINAAHQFFENKGSTTDIIAGFPWYGAMPRQTFVALPGLTLDLNQKEEFEKVVDAQLKNLRNGLSPNVNGKTNASYNSIDTPLWFFWALQQYTYEAKNCKHVWEKYGRAMRQILDAYREGIEFNIKMNEKGLIEGEAENLALTWMDSYVDGKPVVQRAGMPVEVNALWYNAVCFALELAEAVGDKNLIKKWDDLPKQIADAFISEFWCEEHAYLADYVRGNYKDWSIRPNMVIAASLDYSPLDREKQKEILSIAKRQLLTPRGLRTLSPENPEYEGICSGNIGEREKTVHQGTAWPWLIMFFIEGYLKIHKRGGDPICKRNLTRRIVIEKYGIDPAKVTTVYNAVEPIDKEEKAKLKKGVDEKIVTFLGRITMQKGPEYFVEAANLVLKKMKNVRFVMAGSGDMMNRMVKRAAELKISDHFHFTGFLKGDDVFDMFRMSDVFVMPSVSEPFGIVPLEAMQTNVPVIISNQSGVSEILRFAVKTDYWDTLAMADAIYGLLNYPAMWNMFMQYGKKEVDSLQWKNSARNVRDVYYDVLKTV